AAQAHGARGRAGRAGSRPHDAAPGAAGACRAEIAIKSAELTRSARVRHMLRRILTFALALLPAAVRAAPKKKPAEPVKAPSANEKAVSELLGPYRWGMSPEDVLGALGKYLGDRMAPELAKVTDVYEQTRMRKQVKDEVDQVRKSLIKFEGQK